MTATGMAGRASEGRGPGGSRGVPPPRRPVLPEHPTECERIDFLEALTDFVPRAEQTAGWLIETLTALPPARPVRKVRYLPPVTRHLRLAERMGKIGRMIAWLTQEAVEMRSEWRSVRVRRAVQGLHAAWAELLVAFESEGESACDILDLVETECIAFFYAEARGELGLDAEAGVTA